MVYKRMNPGAYRNQALSQIQKMLLRILPAVHAEPLQERSDRGEEMMVKV